MTEPRKPCNVDSWGRCRTHGQYAYRCIDRLEAELSAVKAERDAWESLAQHISENEGVADKEEMNRQVERRVAKPDYKWFASDHESHSSGAGKGGFAWAIISLGTLSLAYFGNQRLMGMAGRKLRERCPVCRGEVGQ